MCKSADYCTATYVSGVIPSLAHEPRADPSDLVVWANDICVEFCVA
jgi:hypothetical protein